MVVVATARLLSPCYETLTQSVDSRLVHMHKPTNPLRKGRQNMIKNTVSEIGAHIAVVSYCK